VSGFRHQASGVGRQAAGYKQQEKVNEKLFVYWMIWASGIARIIIIKN
jgi:hypothetical protein